jgi:KDO2-lipid IV(A) lauroyltransferase
MARKRSRLADFLVYLVLRVLIALIQFLSAESAGRLARAVAWLIWRLDKRHRQVADENLRHAYGEQMSAAERERVIRDVYVHFCTLLTELFQLPRRMHLRNWKRHVELVGARPLLTTLLSGRPVLIVTGHLGNWELAGYFLGLVGFKTFAIARTLDNPYLDDLLRRMRQRTGQKILAKKGDFDSIEGALAGGGILATLADQDAGERGLFVDFFGRPASTHKAVALPALEHQVTILVVGVPRVEGKYQVLVTDVIDPAEYEGRPDAVKALTQRYTSALERVIRVAPEQYFWLHRRWKHQPRPAGSRRAVAPRVPSLPSLL